MPFTSNPIPAIDSECGIEGAGTTAQKIAESKAKNDFCAPTSNVTPITYQTFIDLQKQVQAVVGPQHRCQSTCNEWGGVG